MSQVLLDVYTAFCLFGAGRNGARSRRGDVDGTKLELDSAHFMKLCRDCDLLSDEFTKTDADLLFSKAVSNRRRRATWGEFVYMFAEIAERRRLAPEELEIVTLRAGARPKHTTSTSDDRPPEPETFARTRSSSATGTSNRAPPRSSLPRPQRTPRARTGSFSTPLTGEDLPAAIGRVLPWESPNWAVAPRLLPSGAGKRHPVGWKPGGVATLDDAVPHQPPANLPEARPNEAALKAHRDATKRQRGRRAAPFAALDPNTMRPRSRASSIVSLGKPAAFGSSCGSRRQSMGTSSEPCTFPSSYRSASHQSRAGGLRQPCEELPTFAQKQLRNVVTTEMVRSKYPTGSYTEPLRGTRLPKQIGRVLPWESPNWLALPRAPAC